MAAFERYTGADGWVHNAVEKRSNKLLIGATLVLKVQALRGLPAKFGTARSTPLLRGGIQSPRSKTLADRASRREIVDIHVQNLV